MFDPMAGGGMVADTYLARPLHSAWQEGGRLTGNVGALTWTICRIHDRKLNPESRLTLTIDRKKRGPLYLGLVNRLYHMQANELLKR